MSYAIERAWMAYIEGDLGCFTLMLTAPRALIYVWPKDGDKEGRSTAEGLEPSSPCRRLEARW